MLNARPKLVTRSAAGGLIERLGGVDAADEIRDAREAMLARLLTTALGWTRIG